MQNCRCTRSESGFYHDGAAANILLTVIESLWFNINFYTRYVSLGKAVAAKL